MILVVKIVSVVGRGKIAYQLYLHLLKEKPIEDFPLHVEKYETVDMFVNNHIKAPQVVLYVAEDYRDEQEVIVNVEKLLSVRKTMVILVSPHYNLNLATSAIDRGVFDVINAEDEQTLKSVINLALHAQEVKRGYVEISDLPEEDFPDDMFIGRSEAVMSVYRAVGRVSMSDVPVLITGDTGSGKELVARTIHKRSPFKNGPFVAVNCSAIPETLLESELFGYRRGAFTGAVEDRQGKIEAAAGGTLFLDEIAELSPKLQVKLLRVIQEKEFERLGENVKRKVNARILAATNRNLEDEISQGNFREDLYYRLNVATIHVPPLRERKDDIPILLAHFFKKAVRELHRPVKGITARAVEKMLSYHWPGNVRELINVIYRAVLIARGEYIMAEDIILNPSYKINLNEGPRIKRLWELEKEHIQRVLDYTGGNKSLAARLLGISRPCLTQKIKRYGIVVNKKRLKV